MRPVRTVLKTFPIVFAAVVLATPVRATLVDVTVTFRNLAQSNSVAFAPLRFGFNSGVFDAFNVGTRATAPIISVAEGSTAGDWVPAFAAAEPNATVQKFAVGTTRPTVTLTGPAPGSIQMMGDACLIERVLTNLIDNAIRHAPGAAPVRVSVVGDAGLATVLIEDGGPGLPPEPGLRLDAGRPVRDPPFRRPGGGFGGLGLEIAQRIATIHGGSLKPLPVRGGTRLALPLPLQVP